MPYSLLYHIVGQLQGNALTLREQKLGRAFILMEFSGIIMCLIKQNQVNLWNGGITYRGFSCWTNWLLALYIVVLQLQDMICTLCQQTIYEAIYAIIRLLAQVPWVKKAVSATTLKPAYSPFSPLAVSLTLCFSELVYLLLNRENILLGDIAIAPVPWVFISLNQQVNKMLCILLGNSQ